MRPENRPRAKKMGVVEWHCADREPCQHKTESSSNWYGPVGKDAFDSPCWTERNLYG